MARLGNRFRRREVALVLEPVAPVARAFLGQQHVHHFSVASGASRVSCTSRRVSDAIVVSRNCDRIHLAEPLEAGDVDRAASSSPPRSDRGCRRSRPRRARSTRLCRRRCGTAAASRRRRDRLRRAAGSDSGTARTTASRCVHRRNRRRRECRSCGSASRRDSASRGRLRARSLMSCTSCDASISDGSTSHVFRILPRSGITAWNSRLRACFAEPPAESPSTRNSSDVGSCFAQSASLPGNAGPVIFLRSTFFAACIRRCALSIANSAISSPFCGCSFSHS